MTYGSHSDGWLLGRSGVCKLYNVTKLCSELLTVSCMILIKLYLRNLHNVQYSVYGISIGVCK